MVRVMLCAAGKITARTLLLFAGTQAAHLAGRWPQMKSFGTHIKARAGAHQIAAMSNGSGERAPQPGAVE